MSSSGNESLSFLPSFFPATAVSDGSEFDGGGNNDSLTAAGKSGGVRPQGNLNSGAWGSSSYSDGMDNLNSTDNYTTEEFLQMMLGPKQVRTYLSYTHTYTCARKRI